MRRIILILLLCLCLSSGLRARGEDAPTVLMSTNLGDILIELFPDDAPVTVDNFLHYVNSGFYDDLLFHRVIENFMIQGGGYYVEDNTIYKRWPGDNIINESYNGLSNLRGTIAMARSSEPNSANSQFFINHQDNLFLDRANDPCGIGYCVFGHVIDGMDVVDEIAQAPTIDLGGIFANLPYPLIYINEAHITWPPGYWLFADLNNDGIVNLTDFNMLAGDWSLTAEGQPGDLDENLTVNAADLFLFADAWMDTTSWYWIVLADLSNDGKIDFRDFAFLASSWSQPGEEPADLNRNNIVDFPDLILLVNVWLQGVR
jgi:cyclophilin family peptidyl-prolyl cis-trans isomerase